MKHGKTKIDFLDKKNEKGLRQTQSKNKKWRPWLVDFQMLFLKEKIGNYFELEGGCMCAF